MLWRSCEVLIQWVFAWSAGNWKADKALTLATSPATYPVWEGTALVYTGFALEYKYIVTKKAEVQWENGAVNRRCDAVAPKQFFLFCALCELTRCHHGGGALTRYDVQP